MSLTSTNARTHARTHARAHAHTRVYMLHFGAHAGALALARMCTALAIAHSRVGGILFYKALVFLNGVKTYTYPKTLEFLTLSWQTELRTAASRCRHGQ